VSVTDNLLAGVAFGSATPSQGSCSQSAGTVTCSLGTVASAGTATVTIVVTPNSSGTITNSASVSASTTDPSSSNNSDTADTTVAAGSADLSITKADSPDPATVGGRLTYALTVVNGGPDDAPDVNVSDALPSSVTFVSATPSQGSCSQSAGTVTCSLGAISNSGDSTVTIVVTPNSAGTITNGASVSASTSDPTSANNSDSEDTGVLVGGLDGAMDVIVSGPTKSVASGGSTKVFVTKVCNVGTVNVTVDPVADISTSRTVNETPAGGTVSLLTNPTPMLLRPGACQRYRWEWSYGADGPANPGDTVVHQATWNLSGDGVLTNNTDSETRTAT
jgi:uncharacterized repeat protein (TIGR01451 family)